MATNVIIRSLLVAAVLFAVPAGSALLSTAEPAGVLERYYDAQGRLLYEVGVEPSNPLIGFTKHYLHLAEESQDTHRPNHGGGGGGGGGGTDCTSTAYKTAGWYWDHAYSAYATDYASIFSSALSTWDAETGASISGGVSSGSRGDAGVYDGVNQFEWANLGDGGTIAVTTTWYYRGSGLAVESDAEYNTYYPWSTSGEAGKMDVANIATHEVGHTYGLNHPNGGGISCLTMYAYADYGETQKRTLGTGDILGIEAIYGA